MWYVWYIDTVTITVKCFYSFFSMQMKTLKRWFLVTSVIWMTGEWSVRNVGIRWVQDWIIYMQTSSKNPVPSLLRHLICGTACRMTLKNASFIGIFRWKLETFLFTVNMLFVHRYCYCYFCSFLWSLYVLGLLDLLEKALHKFVIIICYGVFVSNVMTSEFSYANIIVR